MPYLDILILALVAVFVGLRLRSVLGRRDDDDDEIIPPFRQRPDQQGPGQQGPGSQKIGNIIHPAAWSQPVPAREATPLEQIAAADHTFSPETFLNGAKAAFAMIVDAFVRGDESALRPLLADEVFVNFSKAIRARAEAGEVCANQLVDILSAEITDARLADRFAHVTVRFQSRQILCQKNAEGAVLFGDPETNHTITDLWSFSRDVTSRDPNWLLVATQSALEA